MGLRGKRMKNLRIEENSGVDAPAHLAPGWIVRKSADDDLDERIEAVVAQLEKQLGTEQEEMPVDQFVELLTKGRDAVSDEAEKAKFDAAIKAISGGGAGAESESAGQAALAKAQADTKAAEDRAAKAEAALKALTAGAPPDTEAEALTKALDTLPEPLRKAWEANQTRLAEAVAKAEAAEKRAGEEHTARVKREYLEKARDFAALPAKAETLGDVLREVDEKLTKEAGAELLRILKAANALADGDSAAFKELGGPGMDVTDGDAALEAAADEIQKAATAAGSPIDRATAVLRAADSNPGLVNGRGA